MISPSKTNVVKIFVKPTLVPPRALTAGAPSYSESELAVLKAADDFVSSLAGFISHEEETVDENIRYVSVTFDTEENAVAGAKFLYGTTAHPAMKAKFLVTANVPDADKPSVTIFVAGTLVFRG